MKKNQDAILLCEDDVNFGMLLSDYLRQKDYRVDFARDGEEGWQMFNASHYDFCILDVMMPVKTGFELARAIRMTGSQVPIMFLTVRTAVEDVLEGYACGCDDYVFKPCSMDVMMCKIECILQRFRRQQLANTTFFKLGNIAYDSVKQTLTSENKQTKLSSRENELLLLLAQNTNQLVEKNKILTSIWRAETYFSGRSLSVYINHLRILLQGDSRVEIINVHGKGYKLAVPEE